MNKRYLEGDEKTRAIHYMEMASSYAKQALCGRSKCGSVIVNGFNLIGSGFNSPSGTKKRCHVNKDIYNRKVTDKTCCVHAEQRAIMNALESNPRLLEDSTLYFVRIGVDGEITKSGEPYCTICSKMALDVGIKEFVLWHKEGICAYNTEYYNELSYNYENVYDTLTGEVVLK